MMDMFMRRVPFWVEVCCGLGGLNGVVIWAD